MIHLAVGDFEIDWGKNEDFRKHGSLFQPGDLAPIVYEYAGTDGEEIEEMKEGAIRPLSKVVPRLELMGYTLNSAKNSFATLVNEKDIDAWVSFEIVAKALQRLDVNHAAAIYSENYDFEPYFDKIANRLQIPYPNFEDDFLNGLSRYNEKLFRSLSQAEADIFILGKVFQCFHPYTVLRLLGENSETLTRDVSWAFADVVENGWVDRDRIVNDLGQVRRFLVVTEGSSDSKIIKHSLRVLRPEIADFFHFVDMEKGYPFTGEGNLHRFCQGLVSMGIENNLVVVYDNDAAGVDGYKKSSQLSLPKNMRVIRLPDCKSLCQFDTTGPNGDYTANINGRAASIECYLDLDWKQSKKPVVRWTSYKKAINSYQGKLQNKGFYTRQFLKLKSRESEYDYSKIEAILESLISASIKIAEERIGA